MNEVRIQINTVALGSSESFKVTENPTFEAFSSIDRLLSGARPRNYGNPCEYYAVPLDGRTEAFPSNTSGVYLGLWGRYSADGSDTCWLELKSDRLISSDGITLVLDTYNNILPAEVAIFWYGGEDGGTPLSNKIIDSSDISAEMFIQNAVEDFNRLEIFLNGANQAGTRVKLQSLSFGRVANFTGTNIKDIAIAQTVDPISSEIEINTVDLTLTTDTQLILSQGQSLNVYNGGDLIATTFIKTAEQTSKTDYKVSAEDYIGMLDKTYYNGVLSLKDSPLVSGEIIQQIFNAAKVPYRLDGALSTEPVIGFIPRCTCRDALMQVAFAIGAVVDTSNSDVVKLYPLSDEITQEIPSTRVFEDLSVSHETPVTGVEITAHEYIVTNQTEELYSAEKSGTGENILVEFSEPKAKLAILNGKIIAGTAGCAIINAEENCTLRGYTVEHKTKTKSRRNDKAPDTADTNVKSIADATLVNNNNLDKVLNRCYNWLVNDTTYHAKIVEGYHDDGSQDQRVILGDIIEIHHPWRDETYIGRAYSQKFSLYGGSIVKDTEVR